MGKALAEWVRKNARRLIDAGFTVHTPLPVAKRSVQMAEPEKPDWMKEAEKSGDVGVEKARREMTVEQGRELARYFLDAITSVKKK